MTVTINEIDFGIASRIGNKVYLHKDLVNYPELRASIIKHELSHSSGYTKKDLLDDFSIKELRNHKKDYYKFILTTPSSWTEYLPVCKYPSGWIISPTIALFWIFAISIMWFVIRNIR